MADSTSLGPLPAFDDNAKLQEESFAALRAALPVDRFALRDEPLPDSGVDKCIELRISGHSTGMRAHVQVKAVRRPHQNQDGSISYSSDVANLNYLLNGSSPLYVLYIAETKELRYAWIRDEARRLYVESPAWMRQQTVVIRFVDRIEDGSLDPIHDRIMIESRTMREILDAVRRAQGIEAAVYISTSSHEVTTPESLRRRLLHGGLTMVSCGDSSGALLAIDRLEQQDKKLPRILLIQAFAEVSQGRYQLASGHLMEASLRADELVQSDRQFLSLMKDICNHRLGKISGQEYLRRQRKAAGNADDEFGLSRKLDYLWHSLMLNGSRKGIAENLPKLLNVINQILRSSDTTEHFKIQARTVMDPGNRTTR